MKKRIAICAVLFAFAVFAAAAEYYWGLGEALASYKGTTKYTTIEKVYNDAMRDGIRTANTGLWSTPQPFNGKLSKRQSDLLWKALGQYDYAAGEIYLVVFNEEGARRRQFCLTVQIESDRSGTWLGFTSDYLF